MELSEKQANQIQFVNLLKNKKVLFNCSQMPAIKVKKNKAVSQLLCEYKETFEVITPAQILKKIHNLKNKVRKKEGKVAMGNKKVEWKKWEIAVLDLMNKHSKHISNIKSSPSVCVGNPENRDQCRKVTSSESEVSESARVNSDAFTGNLAMYETEETRCLSNANLQRLVLLKQIKVLTMQLNKQTEDISTNVDCMTVKEEFIEEFVDQ